MTAQLIADDDDDTPIYIRLQDQSESAIKRAVNRMCSCHETRANVTNKHFIRWTVKRIWRLCLMRS
jgi:hypothetical protein